MKFNPKLPDEDADQVLDENAALRATVAERDEEIARLREHLQIQVREIAALQADSGMGNRKETAPMQTHGPERKERRVVQLVRR